jgi:uroporphyrinogen-III synthase
MAEPRILLLTRPQAQSEAFAQALAAALPGRFEALVAPLLAIAPVQGPLDLDGVQGLVFTSANGVGMLAARSYERGLPAFCVGDMTTEAARAAGFAARSANGDVADLAALVIAAHRPGGGPFVHVRGHHAAGDLTGRLAAAGVPVRAAEIYEQAPRPMGQEAAALLAAGRVAAAALFSPRTARLFAEEAREAGWDLAPLTSVSISAAADAALAGVTPGRRLIARRPSREEMIAALARA